MEVIDARSNFSIPNRTVSRFDVNECIEVSKLASNIHKKWIRIDQYVSLMIWPSFFKISKKAFFSFQSV